MFVVSSSQLGARERHTKNVIQLLSGPGVHHYWDGERRVGTAIQPYLAPLAIPAWDVWLLYAPGVEWPLSGAPKPDWWEHQLGALGKAYPVLVLDAPRFVAKARELSQLPP